MTRRWPLLLLCAALVGCAAHDGTVVEHAPGADFSAVRHIGVLPFSDAKNQGQAIADGLENGLKGMNFEIADRAALQKLIGDYTPGQELGMDPERLVRIRAQTSADAIVFGKMAPDWSAAAVVVIETQLGDPILSAFVKPSGKDEKAFASTDEIVRETLKIFQSAPDGR